jgi:hypothetical protein
MEIFLYPEKILEESKVNFVSGSYPLLFFSHLLKKLKEKINVKFVDEDNFDNVLHEIHMSFLGQKTVFWFGNLEGFSDKYKNKALKFIDSYSGDNIILFYTSSASASSKVIELQKIKATSSFKELAKFLVRDINKSLDYVIENSFKLMDSFDIDQAILIIWYGSSLGSLSKDFFQNWFYKIVTTERSLFTLSALLLSKDRSFFKYWASIKEDYQPPFWTTYFSELFFRAHWYIYYKEKGLINDAKRISYRLPFNFINKDWKVFKKEDFIIAQDNFYKIDCSIKNSKLFLPEGLFFNIIMKH